VASVINYYSALISFVVVVVVVVNIRVVPGGLAGWWVTELVVGGLRLGTCLMCGRRGGVLGLEVGGGRGRGV